MNEVEKKKFSLNTSIQKIEKNLNKANEALAKNEGHTKELRDLIGTQKGFAKKELMKVLKKSEAHIEELQNHVKEGTVVLNQKKD